MEKNMKKTKNVVIILLALISTVSAQFTWYYLDLLIYTLTSPLLCSLFIGFQMIAGGIAVVILILAGIKWMGGSDDPAARKLAKDMIIHTVIALIIIVLATLIVEIASGGQISITTC